MTKEEAIHFAVCLKNNWTIDFNDMEEFCDMAIKALSADAVQEAVPTVVRVTMSDGNQYYLEQERDECDHCVYKWGMKGGAE